MNNNRNAAQETRKLTSAQFPISIAFLALSQPEALREGSVNCEQDHDCRKAERYNRIDSGKLKPCVPLDWH
jgi:hypothetical protein